MKADHYTVLAGKAAGLDTLHRSKTILFDRQVAAVGLTAHFQPQKANTSHRVLERLSDQ